MHISLSSDLRVSLERQVYLVLTRAFSNCQYWQEPQLIANLVHHFSSANFRQQSNVSIRTGGVFIHSQPFVQCDNFPEPAPASVELGDVLLISTLVRNNAVESRQAMILQAKKISGPGPLIDNKNQYHLYSTHPSFVYVRSSPDLNGQRRRIAGFDVLDATKYLFIADPALQEPYIARAFPAGYGHYRPAKAELVDFVLGNAGKPYTYPPPKRYRQWDKVIDDLVRVTAEKCSVYMGRAQGSGGRPPRGSGRCFTMMSNLSNSELSFLAQGSIPRMDEIFNRPLEVPGNWEVHDSEGFSGPAGDPGGISMIEFVIEEHDE